MKNSIFCNFARWLLLSLMIFILPSCLEPVVVPQVTVNEPIEVTSSVRPVMLKKVMVKIPRGTVIGQFKAGMFCEPIDNIKWQSGSLNWDVDDLSAVIREEFEAAGYKVLGESDSLFDDFRAAEADYYLGALITMIKYETCCFDGFAGDTSDGKGKAYVEVEWQVYSKRLRDVVLKLKSEGSVQDFNFQNADLLEPVRMAFGQAAHNLLAEKEFYDLFVLETDMVRQEFSPITIHVKPDAISTENDATSPVNKARLSVLTIYAGDFHGSGFVISQDGYVLTNQHVVNKAKTITAKTLTGRELLGEVIRVDRAKDVALIKLEKDIYEPLTIGNSSDLQAGTEVYSIGSPLLDKYGQSLSQGIVSGIQTENGNRYIQSDVSIHPGNSGGPLITVDGKVVGVAAMGVLTNEGLGVGINLFIPIEEAIKTLNLLPSNEKLSD
ncbi:MAG: trypsin-like peptidase domain-containing protein [Sedimentisphaerales bacterium]|nr:trypsin-like peptidase domain-containing protein [Sedimentisphaerales bacterium]